MNWDTAGTARYVKNAAAWLFNHEGQKARRNRKRWDGVFTKY